MENRYSFIVEVMANGKYIPAPLYELKELDMEDNKYFTPSIEDIRVGYECEVNWVSGWKKHVLDESLHVYSTHNVFVTAAEAIKRENLKVPYLTKEQLESEGWIEGSKGITTHPDGHPFWIFIKGNFWLNYVPNNNFMVIMKNQEPLLYIFQGECKDINTFRYICKLLNIK